MTVFIGTLRKRRSFVLSFFPDYQVILPKSRRVACVDSKRKKLYWKPGCNSPRIVIPKFEEGAFYETVRIEVLNVGKLRIESDLKPALAYVLKALRGRVFGSVYLDSRHVLPRPLYVKRVKEGNLLYSPYFSLRGSAYVSEEFFRAVRKAINEAKRAIK